MHNYWLFAPWQALLFIPSLAFSVLLRSGPKWPMTFDNAYVAKSVSKSVGEVLDYVLASHDAIKVQD